MDQALSNYINDAMAIADARNLAVENPVVLEIKVGQEVFLTVVSIAEPSHLLLPINVTWIVADPDSLNYKRAMRRTGKAPTMGYRNSWSLLDAYADILAEPQVYDLTNTFVLGELGPTLDTKHATPDRRGTVTLSDTPTDDLAPIVIATEDYRNDNARVPTSHSHPVLPASILLGSSGLNASIIAVNTGMAPVAGQVLQVTNAPAGESSLEAKWSFLEAADVVYAGALFTGIRINGPVGDIVNEATTIQLTADALFSDGGEIADVNVTWLALTGGQHVILNTATGELITGEVTGDQTVSLRATWIHPASAVRRTADVTLTISDLTVPVNLVSLSIDGPLSIDEDTQATYAVKAHYDDASVKGIVPDSFVSSNANAGTLDSGTGIFTAPTALTSTEATTLTAVYTEDLITRNVALPITVRDATVYPSSAVILGPSTLNEGQDHDYKLEVTFSDSTVREIAVTDWAISNAELGTIGASTGSFVAANDVQGDKVGLLTASYTAEGVTVGDTVNMTLTDNTVYPTSARILGVTSLNENEIANFSLEVTFSDTSVVIVPVDDWAASNINAGTINNVSGKFTAVVDTTENQATIITASYTGAENTVVTGTLNLDVLDTTNYPVSAEIIGVTTMNENETIQVSLNVTYRDSSVVQEDITAWTSSDTSVATIVPTGPTAAVMSVTNLLADSSTTIGASFTAHGRTVSDTHIITVNDTTNYPVSAAITGLSSIDEGTSSTYALYVTYADNTTSQVVASSWATSNTGIATANAATGEITAAANLPATAPVTISAEYELDGRTVSANTVINVVDTTVYPVSATVLGPVIVNENTVVNYTLQVRFDDASEVVMPVTDWASSNVAAGTMATDGTLTAPVNIASDVGTVVSASFTRDGVSVSATLNVNVTDATVYPASATILGSDSIDENTSGSYSLEVTFTDASTQTVLVTNWASDDLNVASINANTGLLVATANVDADATVGISASYTADGVTVAANKAVTVVDATEYPVSMVIVGPTTLIEGEFGDYQVDVTYTTARVARENATTLVSSNAVAGALVGNRFTSIDVTSDQVTELSASFNSAGRTINATQNVTVTDATIYPASAEIIGVGSINEGGTASFVLEVTMQDATKRNVTAAAWSSDNTSALTIGAGTGAAAAAAAVIGNKLATISGSFTENGITVTATKAINIVDTTIYPVSAQIVGDAILGEGTTETYVLTVTFNDNSTSNVAVTDWAMNNPAAGTLVANTGVMTAADNLSSTVNATISASYTVDGTTVNDTLAIEVRDTTVYPQSAAITGTSTLNEGAASPLTFTVTNTDNSNVVIPAAGWTSDTPAVATVSGTGVVTGQAVTGDQTATISGTYTAEGITVTDTHVVTVTDTTVYPASMEIIGPNSVAESTATQYTLQVTWSDASQTMETVNTWSSNHASAVAGADGIVTIGDVAANFDYTLSASFAAEGVTVNDNHLVSVADNTNYPVSAAIQGRNVVPEGETETYTLLVTYTDNSTATVLVTDWASSNPTAGSIVASTGVFTPAAVTGTENTTLTASFTAEGATVNGSLVVGVTDTSIPVSVAITGPATATAGDAPVNMAATVTYNDNSTTVRTTEGTWSATGDAGTIDAATGVFTPIAQ